MPAQADVRVCLMMCCPSSLLKGLGANVAMTLWEREMLYNQLMRSGHISAPAVALPHDVQSPSLTNTSAVLSRGM